MSMAINSMEQGLQTAERCLAQIAAQFEGEFAAAMAGSSRQGPITDSSATNGPAAASSDTTGHASDLSPQDTQSLLSGDYYTKKPMDIKATCPPNVSMDQLMEASGGLLKKAGDQQFKGKGADGINGGYLSNLAKIAGGSINDIGAKNPTQHQKDVTLRVEMMLQSCKNAPGNIPPASVRHNGNMSGLQPSKEVCPGSDLAMVQNMIKAHNNGQDYTIPDKRPKDPHMKGNDTEKSGAQMGWDKAGKYILPILAAPLLAIPGVGEVAEGAAIAGEAGAATAEVAEAAGTVASAAGRAAGSAGGAASEAGSSAGASSAADIMRQLATQTAKEGGKEGGKEASNQVQNQLQPPSMQNGATPNQTASPYPAMVSA